LVANVVPEGPAAKAGVKNNDILLRANDVELHEMADLVDLVATEGEKKGQIAVEVLRRGQRETVYITPEERPGDLPGHPGGAFGRAFEPGFGVPGGPGIAQDLLHEFGDMPFEFRQFGPGVIVGGGGAANLPNGVSVSITKQNDEPARITVKRGGESWEIVGDDPESLNQLPAELRPFVEQMLHGGPRMHLRRGDMPEFGDGRLRERLERMEKRMEELQERLQGRQIEPPATQQDGDQVE
jgi:membrane-associated protease RseP (regulator of RpoE activity)